MWKGKATYRTVDVDGVVKPDVAWTYPKADADGFCRDSLEQAVEDLGSELARWRR